MCIRDSPYRQKALKPHDDALFDLEKDPNETINLAKRFPEKVKELKQLMLAFEASLGPVPEPKLKAIPFDDPRNKNK